MEKDERTEIEIAIAAEESAFERNMMKFGELTPFTCPDCHGILFSLEDDKRSRFRCHTGHAFSSDTLLTSVTENIEESFGSVLRGVEESIMLLNHMRDHFAEINQTRLAALYFQKAKEAEDRAALVRRAVMSHERLSKDSLRHEAEETNGDRG